MKGSLVVAAQNPGSSPHRAQGWGHPDSKTRLPSPAVGGDPDQEPCEV